MRIPSSIRTMDVRPVFRIRRSIRRFVPGHLVPCHVRSS